jgi:hypothetical protein
MKTLLSLIIILTSFLGFSQSKKDLIRELEQKKMIISKLNSENGKLILKSSDLRREILKLQSQLRTNFDNPQNYAESFFKILSRKDLIKAEKLLLSVEKLKFFPDEIINEVNYGAKRDSISLEKYIKNLNSKALKNLEDVYYDALNMGIKWSSQTKYKNVEFNFSSDDGVRQLSLKIFFEDYDYKSKRNKKYYLTVDRIFLINDKFIFFDLGRLVDIEKEKNEIEEKKKIEQEKLKNQPYKPYGLKIGGTNWSYNDSNPEKFTYFRCRITNDTDHFVDRVKFKITIYTGSNYRGGTKVFQKTIDLRKYCRRDIASGCESGGTDYLELEPGDTQEIQIYQLRNFFLGEDVRSSANWYVDYEVIEVFPKHNQ